MFNVLIFFNFQCSNNITSTLIYDDPQTGVMLHHNPTGRPRAVTIDDCMIDKVHDLRFQIGSQAKMVLLLSFSTDSMIRDLQKNPECWFLDVTARSNLQKRNLFLSVGRKPSGNSFIGNVTLIPSGELGSFLFFRSFNPYLTLLMY